MSLLTLINSARLRNNLSAVTSAFSNPDTGVQQMIALLQDVGDELAERNQWQTLNMAGTLTGDGVTTIWPFSVGALALAFTDFGSDFGSTGGATYSVTDFGGLSNGLRFVSSAYPLLPLVGPVSNEDLNSLKALPLGIIRPVWRVIDGAFEFWPALALGEIVTYNYYSINWIQTALGTRASAWTADTDISLIDEKILATGLEWRWLKAKGLDYAEEFRRYESRIARADGRQDTRREVAMSSKRIMGPGTWPGAIQVYDGSASEGYDFGNY